ncbi:hypothetical protein [Pseudomonas lactis]|uniref:hypothetical protein n=1 Tax=Pseudomonas lactis TaxID=1615674 RepID=UPI0019FD15B6|nr:hypothetical protein [Pseudomonas lactis]MBA6043792.1 hypothetical protein [Pseudomonas lactis]
MTQHYDWRTEGVRFSFLGCTDEAARSISWEKMVGETPESTTQKKQQGLRHEEGQWEGCNLVVSAQSGRVDVALAPIQPASMPQEPPHLGELCSAALQLRDGLLRLKLPSSSRLAVGAQVHIILDDSKSAAKVLNTLGLSASFDPKWTDIVYQYNDPVKLKGGIEFNRIFKWSQMRVQFVQFAMGADGQQIGISPKVVDKYLLQLELDFNTGPHAQLPHQDAYSRILKEMFDLIIRAGNPQQVA